MTGYAAKRQKWRQEEREATMAGQENPLEGVDKRSRDFSYARRPKKLKEGRTKYNEPRTKYNEPQTKEAEKALLMINAAKERGVFEPHRDDDVLTRCWKTPSTVAMSEAYPRGRAGRM
jgi:hypothetical protein